MTQGLWRDLRVAVRRLAATPLFLIFAVLSLAVGLSVTITAYALIDATTWLHTGMRDPARVAIVTVPVIGPRGPQPADIHPVRTWTRALTRADVDDLDAAQHAFTHLAALVPLSAVVVSDSSSAVLRTEAVSGAY